MGNVGVVDGHIAPRLARCVTEMMVGKFKARKVTGYGLEIPLALIVGVKIGRWTWRLGTLDLATRSPSNVCGRALGLYMQVDYEVDPEAVMSTEVPSNL